MTFEIFSIQEQFEYCAHKLRLNISSLTSQPVRKHCHNVAALYAMMVTAL